MGKWLEQCICNRKVRGSNPTGGTRHMSREKSINASFMQLYTNTMVIFNGKMKRKNMNWVIRSFVCLGIFSFELEIMTLDFDSTKCPFYVLFPGLWCLFSEIYEFVIFDMPFFTIVKREVNVKWTLRPCILSVRKFQLIWLSWFFLRALVKC